MNRALVCVIVAVAASMALPGAASAVGGKAEIEYCTGVSGWTGPAGEFGNWVLSSACPWSMVVSGRRASVGRNHAEWSFPEPGNKRAELLSVSFSLSGSDGSDVGAVQGVRACPDPAAGLCGPLVKPSGSEVTTPESFELTSADGTLPPGANHVEIAVDCVNPEGCKIGDPLFVSKLVLTLADDTGPEISLFDGDIADFDPTNYPGITAAILPLSIYDESTAPANRIWNGASYRYLKVLAEDHHSGVRYVDLRIGGRQAFFDTGCGSLTVIYQLCLESWLQAHVFFSRASNPYELQQGENVLTLSATDGAENVSTDGSRRFLIDTMAPKVMGLRITSDFTAGWQRDKLVNLEWSNGPFDPAKESPVTRAQVLFTPAGQTTASKSQAKPADGVTTFNDLVLPSPGVWVLALTTDDRAGNRSQIERVTVGYDPTVLDVPAADPNELIGGPALEAGVTVGWDPPANSASAVSGVCGYAVSLDRDPNGNPGSVIRASRDEAGWRLPAQLASGDHFLHVAGVTCAGQAGKVAHIRLDIDTTPPVLDLDEPGTGGWHDPARPVRFSAADLRSVVRLGYQIDSQAIVTVAGTSAIVPLSPGTHDVVVTATDAVGNEASRSKRVHFDDSAPASWIEPPDPAAPNVVRATVGDTPAGVVSAALEYRAAGSDQWNTFGTVWNGDPRASLAIARRFPDDLLADGLYELRVVAIDDAGHLTLGTMRSDGLPATLRLPLRQAPALVSGFAVVRRSSCGKRGRARNCKTKRVLRQLVSRRVIGYGRSVAVSGRLSNPAGDPIGGVGLTVLESSAGSPRRQLGSITTDSEGAFAYVAPAGGSRRLIFRYDGSDLLAPTESTTDLLVTGRATLTATPRRVRRGESVKFSGRVLAHGATIPRSGKNVEFELRSRGEWVGLPFKATAGWDGVFKTATSFKPSGRRPVRYRIRARVPWQDGWPFEDGHSKTVVIEVAP